MISGKAQRPWTPCKNREICSKPGQEGQEKGVQAGRSNLELHPERDLFELDHVAASKVSPLFLLSRKRSTLKEMHMLWVHIFHLFGCPQPSYRATA